MFKIFNNKIFIRIISLAMCFIMFFSITTEVHAGLLDTLSNAFQEGFSKLFNKLLSVVARILVSFGDGVVHIITTLLIFIHLLYVRIRCRTTT